MDKNTESEVETGLYRGYRRHLLGNTQILIASTLNFGTLL